MEFDVRHRNLFFLLSLCCVGLADCKKEDTGGSDSGGNDGGGTDGSGTDGAGSASASDDGGAEGGVSEVCVDYGAKVATCAGDPSYAGDYAQYCQMMLDMGESYDGPGCAAAMEDLFVCISGLDCSAMEEGCSTQQDAAVVACPGLFGGGTGG